MSRIELNKKEVSRLSVILLLVLLLIAAYYLGPAITGFVIGIKQSEYQETLNFEVNESTEYLWDLQNPGKIKSIKVSGAIENSGSARIYIESGNERYLIFDSSKLDEESGLGSITGFAVKDDEEDKGKEKSNETKKDSNNPPSWNSSTESFEINESLAVNLDDYFYDKDNDSLIYTASELKTGDLDILLENSSLTIGNKNNLYGNRTLEIFASDNEASKKKGILIILMNKTDEVNITDETINVTQINITNITAVNETVINATNETVENITINKSISINLGYKVGSIYDVDDNGIETTTGIIDLTVEESSFNWNASDEGLCTRWETYSIDNDESTFVCYGSQQCCSLANLNSARERWDEVFYTNYGLYGATLSNIIKAQVIYAGYNSTSETYSEIILSDVANLSAKYYTGLIPFNDVCVNTCDLLGLNETEYKLVFEINDTRLTLSEIDYVVEKEFLSNNDPILAKPVRNITIVTNLAYSINLSQYFYDADSDKLNYDYYETENLKVYFSGDIATLVPEKDFVGARFMFFKANDSISSVVSNVFKVEVKESLVPKVELGKPVRWTETIQINNTDEAIEFLIPETASNISLIALVNDTLKPIEEEKINVIENGEEKSVEKFEKEKELDKTQRKIDILEEAHEDNAKAVLDEEIEEHEVTAELEELIGRESEIKDELQEINRIESENLTLKERIDKEFEIYLESEEDDIQNETRIIVNETADEITLRYYTEPVYSTETEVGTDKIIKIISDTPYENVLAFTDIKESNKDDVKLYWIKDTGKELFSDVQYFDTNLDGLIDRLEWIVPHLSNQTFEVEITILNVQSYPTVNGNWSVIFNTSGIGDLIILASNGTTYTEMFDDDSGTTNDLETLALYCSSYEYLDKNSLINDFNLFFILENNSRIDLAETIGESLAIKGIYVQDYECNETSYWTVKVLTPGVHTQQFNFSEDIAYANNFASVLNVSGKGNQFVDFHYDNFTKGVFNGTNVTGTGSGANVTINSTMEIGRTWADGNNAGLPSINTSGLVLLFHANNESAFGESTEGANNWTVDFSVDVNSERAGASRNNGTFGKNGTSTSKGATINHTNFKFGSGSFEFDGIDDIINVSSPSNLPLSNTDRTFTAWFRARGCNADSVSTILGYGPGATNQDMRFSILQSSAGGVLGFEWNGGGTVGTSNLCDNEWHHGAGVLYSGTKMKVYVDGVFEANKSHDSINTVNGGFLFVGVGMANGGGINSYFNGTIDEVAIWNRTLNESEIFELYDRGKFRRGNFLSQTFDTGKIVNWTYISWQQEVPYQKEIGRTTGDGNDAVQENGFINTSGLVLLMHFNNESGENDSLFRDYSVEVNSQRAAEKANNGTCVTGSSCSLYNFTQKKFGNSSIDFGPAGNEIINITYNESLNITPDFTISTWINVRDLRLTGINYQAIYLWKRPTVDIGGLWIQNDKIAIFDQECFSASNPQQIDGGTLQENTWHHAVATKNGDTWTLYLDSAIVNQTVQSCAMTTDRSNVYIGNRFDQVRPFNGTIDEIAVWNRSLSSNEILKLYKRGALLLNISTRTSDDNVTWNAWTSAYGNNSLSAITGDTTGRYLQYRAVFSSENFFNYTPLFNNISINYSIFQNLSIWDDTDTLIKKINDKIFFYANYTDTLNTINGSNINCSITFNETGNWIAPANMSFNSTNGLYYHNATFTKENSTYYYNVSCDATISGYSVINVIDTFAVYPYLNITISLNDTSVLTNSRDPVYVSGHINLSNGTNVSDNLVNVFRNGTLLTGNRNFIDDSDADFNKGIFNGTNVTGSGASANVTILKNNSQATDLPNSTQFTTNSSTMGFWQFGEGSGQTAADTSPYGNTGTLGSSASGDSQEPTWNSTSKIGLYALSFDGANDYVNVSSSGTYFDFNKTNPFSVEAWIKVKSGTDAYMKIFDRADSNGRGFSFYVAHSSATGVAGKLAFFMANITGDGGNPRLEMYSTARIDDSLWHHVSLTYDGSGTPAGVGLYIDGVEGDSSANGLNVSGTTLNTSFSTSIGFRAFDNENYFNGTIDEVAVWNISLGAETVLSHYQRGLGYNSSGNFTSGFFDSGGTANWTYISWQQEAPYQKEIGKILGDGNNAALESGYVNTSGLVLLMHFNNETGENDSLVKDYSVDANSRKSDYRNGTCNLQAGTCPTYNFTSKKFGNASMDFDGTDDYINTTRFPEFDGTNANYTIELWARKDDNLGNQALFMYDSDGILPGNDDIYAYVVSTTLRVNVGDSEHDTAITIPLGEWFHVALIRSNISVSVYFDGRKKFNYTETSGKVFSSDHTFLIANDANVNHWDGAVDEVAVWNRSLSSDEILKSYKRGVLRLNISTRTSNDSVTWNAWSNIYDNNTLSYINSTAGRYLQYKASFGTEDASLTPILNNITINYTGLFTDSYGNYNFTFNAPAGAGTYPIKANTTFNGIPGENSVNLIVVNVTSDIIINASPRQQGFGKNVTLTANITDNLDQITSVLAEVSATGITPQNFTMINQSPGIWQYNFTDYTNGTYAFKVYTSRSGIITNSSNNTFEMFINLTMQVRTVNDNYGPMEIVNLTDPPGLGIDSGNEKESSPSLAAINAEMIPQGTKGMEQNLKKRAFILDYKNNYSLLLILLISVLLNLSIIGFSVSQKGNLNIPLLILLNLFLLVAAAFALSGNDDNYNIEIANMPYVSDHGANASEYNLSFQLNAEAYGNRNQSNVNATLGQIYLTGLVTQPVSTQLGGSTTNLSNQTNLESVCNAVFENTTAGKIEYRNCINAKGMDIDNNVIIRRNYAEIKANNLHSTFNRSANITLTSLGYLGYPKILKDNSECSDCSIISWDSDSGIVVFNVSSFSIYNVTEGNQSKVQNSNLTNVSVYLLVLVQFLNKSNSQWVDDTIMVNDTAPRSFGANGSFLKLDSLFNGRWNTSANASFGTGTYRIFAAATDENDAVLQNIDGRNVSAVFNFTLTFGNPAINFTSPTLANNSRAIGNAHVVNVSVFGSSGSTLDTCTLEVNNGTSPSINYTMQLIVDYCNVTINTADGYNYTLRAYVNDTAGSLNSTGSIAFTENQMPETPVLNRPLNSSRQIANQLLLNYTTIDNDTDSVNYIVYFGTDTNPIIIKYIGTSKTFAVSTADGTVYYWKVQADDSYENSSNSTIFQFTENDEPPIPIVVTPNATGIKLRGSQVYNISWVNSTADTDGDSIRINLFYSTDSGLTFPNNISYNRTNNGTYDWLVPSIDTNRARIKIVSNDSYEFSEDTGNNDFTIDSTAPVITLDNPPNGSSFINGTFINLTIADNLAGVSNVSWNNGSLTANRTDFNGTYDINTTGWAIGEANITIYANDSVGNFISAYYRFNITDLRSVVEYNVPSANQKIKGTVRVNVTSTSSLDDVPFVNFTYSGAAQNFTMTQAGNNYFYDFDTTAVSDGLLLLSVYGNDTQGRNVREDRYITVDNTQPAIMLDAPANDTWKNSSVTFTFAPNDANNINNCSLIINNTINTTSSSITKAVTNNFTNTEFGNGIYIWTINCTDEAANIGTNESARLIKIDTIRPVITLVDPPNGSSIRANRSINFTITDTVSGVANITWSNNYLIGMNQLIITTAANSSYAINTSDFPEGSTNVTIRANDSAGNIERMELFYIIDLTPPIATFNAPGANQVVRGIFRVNVTATDTLSNVSGLLFAFNGSINFTMNRTSPETTSYYFYDWNTTNATDKQYIMKINGNDTANNLKFESRFAIVDNTAPEIRLDSPSNDAKSTSTTNIFTFTPFEFNTLSSCSLLINGTVNVTATSLLKNDSNSMTATLGNGVYRWTVICNDTAVDTDGLHNIGNTSNFTITVDTIMPVFNATINNTSPAFGSVVNITGNATDESGLSFGQVIVNDTGVKRIFNFSLSGNSGQFSQNITVACYGGCVINFTARVNDTSNNIRTNDTIIVVTDGILPVVNTSLNKSLSSIALGDAINITANATDESGLSYGQIITNMSGFSRFFNFTLSGTSSTFSQNISINVVRGNVINFTARVNDTSNNIRTNDTIIAVADTLGSAFIGLNLTSPEIYDVINISGNATDIDNDFAFGIVSYNISGNPQLNFTFDLSNQGVKGNFSQNITVNLTRGNVLNFTVIVNDTAGTRHQNSSLVAVADFAATNLSIGTTNTTLRIYDRINITGNATDYDKLDYLTIGYNISGNSNKINFSFDFRNNITALATQNFTINQTRGNVLNFTIYANDTVGTVYENSTLITVEDTLGSIFISLNLTSPVIGNVINITGNATDVDRDYAFGIVSYNISGNPQLNFTFDLSNQGVKGNFSQNITVNLTRGNVLNFTVIVNDTAGTRHQNSSLVAVADFAATNLSIGTTNNTNSLRKFDLINITGNVTDYDGLSFVWVEYNLTANLNKVNYTFNRMNNITALFTQNFTINLTGGNVLNFTIYANDTAGDINYQNSTLITVANTIPSTPSIVFPTSNLHTSLRPLDLNITATDTDNDALNISYYINGILNQTSLTNTTLNATDGYYVLNISVSDGTDISANATVNFTIDTISPAVSLIQPANSSFNSSASFVATIAVNDTNIVNCTLYHNITGTWQSNETINATSGQQISFSSITAADSVFVWDSLCIDKAGNSAFNASNFTITIDTTAPTSFNLTSPSNSTSSTDLTPDFAWQAATEINFANYTLEISNGSSFDTINYSIASTVKSETNATIALPTDRAWHWRVIAFDKAGNNFTTGFFVYTTQTAAVSVESTSGGTGGGGGGGGGTVVLDSATNVWDSIESGSSVNLEIEKETIPVTHVVIENIKFELNNVELKVDSLVQKPVQAEPAQIVYNYFSINKKNIQNNDAENFKIGFKVQKSWLNENNLGLEDIALYRFDTKWNELHTKVIGDDNLYAYYETDTPGFSFFAIGLRQANLFGVNPDNIKVKLKLGGTDKKLIVIRNVLSKDLKINLGIEGLNDYLILSDDSVDLSGSETAQVTLEFKGSAVGSFAGKIVASADGFIKEIPVILEVVSERVLFDVQLDIPGGYSTVEPGSILKSQITLFNLGAPEKVDVFVTYFIKDLNNKVIYENEETFFVEKQISFQKTFEIADNLKPGSYVAVIEVRYADSFAVSSQFFKVEESGEGIAARNDFVTISLISVMVMFIIIVLYTVIQKKSRR